MGRRKVVSSYDDKGWFIGVDYAYESPLEPGVYHMPANSTDVQMPFIPDGHVPFWNGEQWEARIHPDDVDAARRKRDALLDRTDWCVLPDAPFTEAQQNHIRLYRQKLREVPQQPSFPVKIEWPQLPDFLH